MKSKAYYGLSMGVGVEIKVAKSNYLNIEFLAPDRSDQFKEDFRNINSDKELFPVLGSVGYHITI